MHATIEEINGKKYTVIWHDGNNWIGDKRLLHDGSILLHNPYNKGHHIATALPALPRKPNLEDAPLLYRCMAEGITPIGFWRSKLGGATVEDSALKMLNEEYKSFKITHATDTEGSIVEVAIEEDV